ncbi:MAG: acyl--CoA ligase family protein [Bryobacteraceae bacterium]|nr:acyl--CoA ligase family protein [Bryobacteraceae bacterium]MDW8379114.1 acyl--CoA ligase family protein [Bryobacterales bacterium]
MKRALTPLTFLARSGFVYRDKVAVIHDDLRFRYAEFQDRCHRLAAGLRALGVEPGDRVAVLAPNTPMALEPHFAVPLIGAVLVMLNTRLAGSELAWILNHSGAKVILADPQLVKVLDPHRAEMPELKHVVTDYEAFLAGGVLPLEPLPEPDEDGLLSINYTSGTTGFPKGVMYSHRGAYLNALGELLQYGLCESSVYLWVLPLFHCNGWCFPWAVTAAGATHVCLRQAHPEQIAAAIASYRVTHFCGAPVVVGSLAHYAATQGIRFDHGLRIITAGAPPSPAVLRAAEAMGAEIFHCYGLTETYGPMTLCDWRREWDALPPEERARIKARQGVPYIIAGTDVRVVDEQMNDVPADGVTMGEVVMRGNNVMIGYYKNPQATEQAFQGGWFHSGDYAVMHPNGYLEIRDRKKDIIISGGENISSVEVERVLYEHPAVLEAAVVAVPDEKWGEVPKAFLTLKEGHWATPEEIIAFCRERMAHFKCPKHVEFRPLPKTATGKIRKNELRELEWAGREKRVN